MKHMLSIRDGVEGHEPEENYYKRLSRKGEALDVVASEPVDWASQPRQPRAYGLEKRAEKYETMRLESRTLDKYDKHVGIHPWDVPGLDRLKKKARKGLEEEAAEIEAGSKKKFDL